MREYVMGECVIVERRHLQALVDALGRHEFTVIAPTVRSKAVTYQEITSIDELPVGMIDEQDAGVYRLKQGKREAVFDYTVGADSWKSYLHPPALKLFSATRDQEDGFTLHEGEEETPRYAFFGVRACELNAIAIQDKVFLGGPHIDVHYKRRREETFIVGVNCGRATGTCFCVSMNTGPRVGPGYDLTLTEVIENGSHVFVTEIGSERGAAILAEIPHTPADENRTEQAAAIVHQTAKNMGRRMETEGIKELLYENLEHPRWDDVASRCLACANCTMVCPTCFCTTVEDVTDLTGEHVDRWQKWDSCFTMDFSYIHGGSVRKSNKARYRQWMTHKLATWIDQFDSSGCVGCGRCISWCPVGIDITIEVDAIRKTPKRSHVDDAEGETS